jgi:small-conductance mechanosensitive channel
VRETFIAALATTPAAEAVGSGQLTRALSYAGFGDVDLSEATAAPAPARRPVLRVLAGGSQKSRTTKQEEPEEKADEEAPQPEPAKPDPALRQRLRTAEKRSRETMSEAARAGDALSEATEALEALDARIADLDAQLKESRAQRPALASARTEAQAANRTAERTLRAALAEVDQVRRLLPDDADD